MNHKHWHMISLLSVTLMACGVEDENRPSPQERWAPSGAQHEVTEPVSLRPRTASDVYGLPRSRENSISDLVALLPSEDIERDGPKFFSSSAQPLMCTNGRTSQIAGLPMVVEGVVTIPGTYYIKVSVCDQEEKFYGSFAIEDDTGGIMVLRDSRVAQVQPGNVVRLTVHTLVISDNFGRIDSRAVLSYDLEILPESRDLLFSTTTQSIDGEHVGRTTQVEGFMLENPSNLNFSTMVLSDREMSASSNDISSVCRNYCLTLCTDASCAGSETSNICDNRVCDNCEAKVCPTLCADYDEVADGDDPTNFLTASMPTCWVVGLNQELLRRGYSFYGAKRLRATGPVLRDYSSYTITVERLGQIEVLE